MRLSHLLVALGIPPPWARHWGARMGARRRPSQRAPGAFGSVQSASAASTVGEEHEVDDGVDDRRHDDVDRHPLLPVPAVTGVPLCHSDPPDPVRFGLRWPHTMLTADRSLVFMASSRLLPPLSGVPRYLPPPIRHLLTAQVR